MSVFSKMKGLRKLQLILLSISSLASSVHAGTVVIHAGTLIAQPGSAPARNQSIIVEDGKIKSVVAGFVPGDKVIDLSRSYVLPGLIDVHTHVTGMSELNEAAPARWTYDRRLERQSIAALDAIPILRDILRRGFTTIRNLGDPASVTYDLRDAIAAGKIEGPRMLVSEPQFGTPASGYRPQATSRRRSKTLNLQASTSHPPQVVGNLAITIIATASESLTA